MSSSWQCYDTVYIVSTSEPITLCSDWDERQEDPKNADLWDKSWDDDRLDDEFARQLREQLASAPQQQPPPQPQKTG